MSLEPLWVRLGPVAFWQAAWETSVATNPRCLDAEADEVFWSGFASTYDERSPLAACAEDLIVDLQGLLPQGGSLLEIGSGTGAFTRRLASGLSAITCVEPSAAMRRAFEEAWDQPIQADFIETDWLMAPDHLTADVVLCANALYRTADIASALSKMTRAARGHVAVVQSVGKPHAGPLSVQTEGRVWERERADALCDVLRLLKLTYERRDYRVQRPDSESQVALITLHRG